MITSPKRERDSSAFQWRKLGMVGLVLACLQVTYVAMEARVAAGESWGDSDVNNIVHSPYIEGKVDSPQQRQASFSPSSSAKQQTSSYMPPRKHARKHARTQALPPSTFPQHLRCLSSNHSQTDRATAWSTKLNCKTAMNNSFCRR